MHPLETFCGVGNRPVDGIVSPALGTKQVFIGLNNILGFPSSSTGKRTHLQCRRSWFDSCVRKFSRRRDRLPTPVSLGFPDGSDGKESACNVGDLCLIRGLGRSPWEGNGYPLQYSGLENFMDRGTWQATVHGVAKSQTWLSNFHFASLVAQLVKNPPAMRETWVPSLGWEDPLEKGKATHFSILDWRIP